MTPEGSVGAEGTDAAQADGGRTQHSRSLRRGAQFLVTSKMENTGTKGDFQEEKP